MSQRPHGKAPVSDEGCATSDERAERKRSTHGEKHVHLTNSIHIRRHLHLQSHGAGLMLDARRTTLQLPLLREVTALQKIRTLQDPGTSSSVSASSGGSSAGRGSRNVKSTFIGDPHRDAQALAIELSGKLAKSAKVAYSSDGGSSRVSRPQRRGEKGVRVENLLKRGGKKMTAEDAAPHQGNGGVVDVPMKVDVRDRIKRIEQAFQDGSTTNTLSGELRKEGLIKELKERGRIKREAEKVKLDEIPRSDERWEGGPARREELARRVIEERGSSISSLSQLLGNHYGSGRSAVNLLNMVDDDERRSNRGESLFETDEDELSPMAREMTRPRSATMNPASPLHLASLSRGKEELKKSRNSRGRKPKPGRARSRERTTNAARPRSSKSMGFTDQGFPPSSAIVDDELDVSELPPQNGCGIPWDWSRIHKYGGKAFLDLTGLACTLPESTRRHGLEAMMAEQNLPVQSISSLDSDANALPLIIGEDAHDSDFAGYSIETGRSREVPQRQARRRVSLQNAVKDVPVVEPASTSRSKEEVTPPPEGPRTLTQKYRPKNFKEIVGQAVVVKSLSTAILKGKVAPVYLFMGPRGTGKTTAARVFAAGLNCESLDYARPCGICRECGTMALNRSTDVLEIDAASNVDLASMKARMGSFMPRARYKVFIVEGCDSLSTDIWNAFLKVLEEPPTNVVFVLVTTDAEQIPATATSRCQKFHFLKVKEADIVGRLELLATKEGMVVEVGALELIAARSDGSLRDAEIVLDQLCLLDKNVSVALVRELVGLLPDTKILDLLDYALSADTVNTVRTLREVLASGVEPLALVSQLGALITDIIAGSFDVRRETREAGFFNRNFSVKEEQHRLRQALKTLSESEKQLRVTSDRATWLTAALLQFAPDRSFLPSEANTSVAPSPLAPQSTGPAPNHSLPRSDLPSMDEPEYQTQLGSSMELGRNLQAYVESAQKRSPEVENTASLSEQKLEEAGAREPQQNLSVENVGETSEARPAPEFSLEFRVFRDEALAELWKQVLREITSRSLKHLLQTHGRLVAAGVAIDGSFAVVELEFDYPRDKHKAERSWRSICIAFQAVLNTAVELRIALNDMPPDEAEAARIGETMMDMQPGPSTPPKNTEIVTEDSNGDYSMRPGPSTLNPKHKEIAHDDDAYLKDIQGAPSRSHRRRATKARKHRHATEVLENDLRTQRSPGGITPRQLPPTRRRRVKRNPKTAKTVIPVREMRLSSLESSSFGGGEVWDSGPQLIVMERPSGDKKLLSTMIEEPQSEIEDIRSARKKIWEQRSARIDSSQPAAVAALERRTSLVDAQRGLPKESLRCWKRASPQPEFLMRKSRVKGLRKARGKTLFLRLVPCSEYRTTRNPTPAPTAPISESTAK